MIGRSSKPGLNGAGTTPRSSLSVHDQSLYDSVNVRVETFLAETEISVARVNAIKEGEILTLDAGLNELVELRVNGVTIAHGELVAVGDRFGVRITSVAK